MFMPCCFERIVVMVARFRDSRAQVKGPASVWPSVRTLVASVALLASVGGAMAAGTLRVAMTASDIPLPNGQTDQGAEGMRFMGYTVFEALVAYDLSSADKPSSLIPGLALAWKPDAVDKNHGGWA